MKPFHILARAIALACLLFAGLAAPAFAQVVKTPLYVYKGNGCDGRAALPAWEAFIGRKADGVVDFVAQDGWSSFDSDGAWTLGCWKGSGYKLALSVPLTMWGTSLSDVAAGKQDAHFAKLAAEMVSAGYASADIRLGWEADEGHYAWAAAPNPAAYIAAFDHVVTLMRASAGAHFQFVWNPALGWQQIEHSKFYPGDAYVDKIGYDVYSQGWNPQDKAEPGLTNDLLTESWGLNGTATWHADKPIVFGEWGSGTRSDGHGAPGNGDDPTFVSTMANWIAAHAARIAWVDYWDFHASDFNGQLSNGQYPLAAKAFLAAFGTPPAAPAAPVVAAPKATFTAWASDGATVVVTPTADGGGVLTVTFPKTPGSHHYTIWLSTPRQVETWGRMPQIGWDTAGGTATVHVGAN